MRLLIHPSPVPELKLTQYAHSLFPTIRELIEQAMDQLPPEQLLRVFPTPEDLHSAVVAENSSHKAVTAIQYRWLSTNDEGKTRPHQTSSDSYIHPDAPPVLRPGGLLLVTPHGLHNMEILERIVHRMGVGGGSGGSGRRGLPDAAFVEFTVDFLLFEDGEIAGPDPNEFEHELIWRRKAALYVAKQMRHAISEKYDPLPVFRALQEIPEIRGEYLVRWIKRHSDHLFHNRAVRNIDPLEWQQLLQGKLKYLENFPELPRFYRRAAS